MAELSLPDISGALRNVWADEPSVYRSEILRQDLQGEVVRLAVGDRVHGALLSQG